MLQCFCCVAAKGVIRDTETNNISVFSILEQIGPAGFPFVIQDLALLALWRRSNDDPPEFDVEIILQNNSIDLHRGRLHVDFGPNPVNRSIITFQGVIVAEPGTLRFSLTEAGVERASYQILIRPPETRVGGSSSTPRP